MEIGANKNRGGINAGSGELYPTFVTKMRVILIFLLLLPTLVLAEEPMRFVYYDDYRPRSWNENGKVRGILVDIVDEAVGKRLGIPVSHFGYPLKRAQQMVKTGLADAFVTLPTQERRSYTVVGNEPIIVFTLKLATRQNHPKISEIEQITTIEQLKDYTIVDYLGDGWAQQHLKNMNVHWLSDIDSIFPFLIQGRADVVILSTRTIFEMHRQGYDPLIKIFPHNLSSVSFYLCVGKHSSYKDRIDEIDSVLKEMRGDGVIDRIENGYYK
ncbi:transporter substrate-binding domain-containing protein [uncultured Desulfosarcina sp.]|uniref:substrate-binding periplasmic protein n=1 Tax=uncultured Desulfosarcina sp. TaxID=218289 RepID=UPI0029C80789|nr:transporter substrate-binding domain-containing protein [uncultured Desulfosarcina sp.]